MVSRDNFIRLLVLLTFIAPCLAHGDEKQIAELPQQIFQYMERPEPDFAWKKLDTIEAGQNRVHRLELTSQKWQNILWKHALVVYEPKQLVHKQQMLLFVTGGSNGRMPQLGDFALGLALADACGARVATLHQVPNQPLFENRVEDDLITETWLRYLETGDATWPLLFPMAKSAVKAMDALQQFARSEFQQDVTSFVISGASKRGWTSWLTPVVDKRIVATAPIVIDVLNFPAQMQHQKKTWGVYSEQIADYTSKGLVHENGIPEDGREAELWKMMDPFTYRSRLTMPKLIVVGANDRYWTVDAMNLYWDQLPGTRHIHRAPNAGHGLDQGRDYALTTIAVFFRHVAAGKSLPEISWKPQVTDTAVGFSLQTSGQPLAVRIWSARSATNDFRESKWTSADLQGNAGKYFGSAAKNGEERVAVFGEAQFEYEGLTYSINTLVWWK